MHRWASLATAGSVALFASSAVAQAPPKTLPYIEGQPAPYGYHVHEKPKLGLIITGASLAGVAYLTSFFAASIAGFDNQSGWLLVPGIGPFMTLATRDGECDSSESDDSLDCLAEGTVTTLLVIDGLMQTAGGILLVLGLSSKTKVYRRNDLAVEIAPMRVGSGHGLGVVGTF